MVRRVVWCVKNADSSALKQRAHRFQALEAQDESLEYFVPTRASLGSPLPLSGVPRIAQVDRIRDVIFDHWSTCLQCWWFSWFVVLEHTVERLNTYCECRRSPQSAGSGVSATAESELRPTISVRPAVRSRARRPTTALGSSRLASAADPNGERATRGRGSRRGGRRTRHGGA